VSRTHRLELDDQTLREWDAVVMEAGPDGIVLDRSAFYPGGGGQPPDADGGTYVASTAAVGRISVVKVENKGKGFRRLRIAIGD
jgi:Ser-tRNA(Ala) deacylase AlaX